MRLKRTKNSILKLPILCSLLVLLIFVLSGLFSADAKIENNPNDSKQVNGASFIRTGRVEVSPKSSNIANLVNKSNDYTISDVREILEAKGLYEYMRVHNEFAGVDTYDVSEEHVEGYFTSRGNQLSQTTQSYNYTLLREGNGPNNSIVVVIMGDGFTLEQQGTPEIVGSFLYHAYQVMQTMINTHPFTEFSHWFRVYALHTISEESGISGDHYINEEIGNGPNRNTYFNTRFSAPSHIGMPVLRRNHARSIARTLNNNVAMMQIIANSHYNSHGGRAWFGSYTHGLSRRLALTSTWNLPSNYWDRGWHGTFIHEFGHAFGQLNDEHGGANWRRELSANTTRNGNPDTVKWQHFRGYGRVLEIPRSIGNGWYVPAADIYGDSCIMAASWSSNQFSAVAASELTRRLAYITGESFFGKNLNGNNNPIPQIRHFTAPQHANRILPYAFHGNTNLETIRIHSNVEHIHRFAFIGTRSLIEITNYRVIPQAIDDTTFAGLNRSNIVVRIPVGTYQAYRNAGWTGFNLEEMFFQFNSVWGNENVEISVTPGVVLSGNIIIPSTVIIRGVPHDVIKIAAHGFSNQADITSINIPNSIVIIGLSAFDGNTNLRNVIISETDSRLEEIGNSAFRNTTLTEFTIPRHVTRIGTSAFERANLSEITIPSNVISVEANAFSMNAPGFGIKWEYNQNLLLPADHRTYLTEVIIDYGITEISSHAFQFAFRLTHIEIPSTVRWIGANAFDSAINLRSIVFTNDSRLEGIGFEAFRNCESLTHIEIPRLVRDIGERAFEGSTRLTSVNFHPESHLRDIWAHAFERTGIITITIPQAVLEIGDFAFRNASNLRSVYILRTANQGITRAGRFIFEGAHPNLIINTPDDVSYSVYAQALNWHHYRNRMVRPAIHLELNQTRIITSDLISGSREFTFFNNTPRFVRIVLSGGVMPWEQMIVVRNVWGPMEVLDGMGMAETSMFSTEVTVFLPHVGNFFIDTQFLSGPGQIFLRIEEVQRHVVDFSTSAPLRLNIFRGGYGSEMHRVILNQNARFNVSIPNTPGLIFIIYRFDGNGFDFSNSHWFFNGGNGTVTLPAGTYYMGYFQGPRGWSAGSINITRINVPLMFSLDVDTIISNHNAITEEDFEILRMILNKDMREQECLPFQ